MRRLLFVIIAAALGWAGYWFYGASLVRGQIEAYFDTQTARGWQAEYRDLAVTGFPNRFDTILTDVTITDTEGQVQWQTPRLESYMLSYNWKHRIFIIPSELTLAKPSERLATRHDALRLSLEVNDLKTQPLKRMIIEGKNLNLSNQDGLFATMQSLNFALEEDPEGIMRYRLGLNIDGLDLPQDGQSRGGNDQIGMDAFLTFDRPLDRRIWRAQRPQITQVDLRHLKGAMGPAKFTLTGQFDIGTDGTPEGDMTVRISNWKTLLQDSVNGYFKGEDKETAQAIVTIVEMMFGNKRDLDIPLRMSEGKMYFGMFPIGKAPTLRIP